MKRWYVVHTLPQSEGRAVTNLKRQGFETWLPEYRRRRRHAGRSEIVARPVFPRYLFVHLDLAAEQWRRILSTYGVRSLVGNSDGPTPIDDAVVKGLRGGCDADGYVILSAESFQSGDPVRIVAGPLADLEGIFQARDDDERVVVLLGLLGRSISVTVPSTDIERP
ncbi:MAG: transcriptional activator RfaH [Rhodospirillaceae bacterium]|nr:transcriptional activator RfaH [Rhodospirillaceae bacterium]